MSYRPSTNRVRRANACLTLIGVGLIGLAPVANARVTQINISTLANTPVYPGTSFAAGEHQMVNGTIKGEVDPKDPLNAGIVHIDLAARNAHGKIAFEGGSADELNNNELVRKFYLGL